MDRLQSSNITFSSKTSKGKNSTLKKDPEKEEEVSGWLIRLVEGENRKKGWKGTALATKWATLQGCLVNLLLQFFSETAQNGEWV